MKSLSFAAKTLACLGAVGVLAACAGDRVLHILSQSLTSVQAALPDDLNPSFVWDCRQQLGNPERLFKGMAEPDPTWEKANLVRVALPWHAHAAWDRKQTIRSLEVHRQTAASLQRALDAIWNDAGQSQAEIDRIGLSSVGGAYNFRTVREGEGLSAHAYGCAVDLDPARNPQGSVDSNLAKTGNNYVVRDFEAQGWTWGGTWPRPDGMHFQATSTAIARS